MTTIYNKLIEKYKELKGLVISIDELTAESEELAYELFLNGSKVIVPHRSSLDAKRTSDSLSTKIARLSGSALRYQVSNHASVYQQKADLMICFNKGKFDEKYSGAKQFYYVEDYNVTNEEFSETSQQDESKPKRGRKPGTRTL